VLRYCSLTLLVSEHICGNGFKSQHLVLQKRQASKLSKTFTEAVGGCLGNCHWAVTICWIERWSQDSVQDSNHSEVLAHTNITGLSRAMFFTMFVDLS
jgi:hypothetical protein